MSAEIFIGDFPKTQLVASGTLCNELFETAIVSARPVSEKRLTQILNPVYGSATNHRRSVSVMRGTSPTINCR